MAMAEQACELSFNGGKQEGKQERGILNQRSLIGKAAQYFTTVNKPLLLFPAQFLCSFLLVLFPAVLHLIYTVTTGDADINNLLSDFNFLSDWFSLELTVQKPRSVSTAGQVFRLTGISVHLLAASLMWPICTHIAASCLLGANPPLTQSLKAALRAWRRVLTTSLLAFLLPSQFALATIITRLVTGAPLPPAKEPDTGSVGPLMVALLIGAILLLIYLNTVNCFCLVVVSLTPFKKDEAGKKVDHRVARAYQYTRGWRLMLFLLHLQFYVPHLNYDKFERDVKGGNIVPVALALMNICAMAFVKVYIVIFLCALYLHRRAAQVDSMELEPRKEMASAKICSPFVSDNRATILGLVADFDESLRADFPGHHSVGGGKSYQTLPGKDVSQSV